MKNLQFIPSIYNYCDRWCERCSKSSQCQIYANELENPLPEVGLNFQNEAFWERVFADFTDGIRTLNLIAESMGINIEELEPALPPVMHQRFAAIIKEAVTYGLEVNNWLNDFQKDQVTSANFTGKGSKKRYAEINDACDTIRWYGLQIGVKIKRASSRFEHDFDGSNEDDQNGSAKVALIGLNGSIDGFVKILKNFPLFEDSILVFLAKLAMIKQEVNHLFPGAESFRRPGFDD